MFNNQVLNIICLLLISSSQIACSTDNFDQINYQRSAKPVVQTNLRLVQSQVGHLVGGSNDNIDLRAPSHVQVLRSSIVKPANNQKQVISFNQLSPVTGNVLHQTNSNDVTRMFSNLESSSAANDLRNNHHHRQYQPQSSPAGPVKQVSTPYLTRPIDQGLNVINNEASLTGRPSDLELALRQVSGDESVFQPSPAILTGGHSNDFDWLTQASGGQQLNQAPSAATTTTTTTTTTTVPPTTIATTMTGLSLGSNFGNQNRNEIAEFVPAQPASPRPRPAPKTTIELAKNVTGQLEPVVLDHHQSAASFQDHYHDQQRSKQREPPPSSLQTTASSSIEFSNQVIYEGPVTPPPARDDYYFSTSERLPSTSNSDSNNNNNNYYNEHADSNAWWAIGVGEEFQRVNNLTRDNYREYCDRSPLLNNNRQRSLCRMHPRVMSIVAKGVRMAIDECQKRFAYSRWNCSLILNSYSTANQLAQFPDSDISDYDRPQHGLQIFGDVMRHPNRERSFLNAISAAALAHSMTKACRQGELPDECGCDRKIKSNHKGRIEWIGCSDDIDYGAKFSKDFTDNFDTNEPDATRTIYLHNSEVGRRVFKSTTDITCNCLNGENGLCETKRCWKHMGSFSDVVDQIMERYESATHVQRSNKDPQKLRPVRRGVRKPKRKDLVYIDESPDYCQQDTRIGVLGTHNRVCNSTSQGPESCSLLCCGRGFQNVVEHIEEDCNCKFVWCCQVKCDKCSRYVTNEICN